MRDVLALPKAHLHLHFEGSARPSTIVELAARAGVTYEVPTTFSSFGQFNDAYTEILRFITEPGDVTRICREIVEDDAGQGVQYIEPMLSANAYTQKFGMSEADVFALMRDAFLAAGAEFGIEVGLMIAGIWTFPIEDTIARATFAASHADNGVVAFGLAGIEPTAGYEPWARACDIARDANLQVIPHAGEFGPASNVTAAIDVLRGVRVAHGVRAVEDPHVIAQLAERGIICDIAPTSNVILGVYPRMERIPILTFLAAGVPITLNADDSLFFGSGVGDEYGVVREAFGLSDHELAAIARTSVVASRASSVTKARMQAGIDEWLV